MLVATNSQIHAYSSSFVGGPGYLAYAGVGGHPGSDGAPGAELDSSFLFLGGCAVQGGEGGFGLGDTKPCGYPGDGAPGILFTGGPSQVYALDADIQGGPGGVAVGGFYCFGAKGADGTPSSGAAGSILAFPGQALALATSRTVPPGGDVALALSGGPPGAPAFLGLGAGPTAVFVPTLFGTLLVEGPYEVLSLGVLDGSGALATSLPAGALPPGDEGLQLHMQAGYLSPALEVVLGGPSEVTVTHAKLDPSVDGGTVWTVDAAGGAMFTTLPSALDSAQPGDTLLVKGGWYPEFFVVTEGVTIVAEEGQTVTIASAVTITGIPAGQRAVLRGLDIGRAVELRDNAGAVWLEDVELIITHNWPALGVFSSPNVTLVRSRFEGWDATSPPPFLPATPGILAEQSGLHVYGCSVEGGKGQAGVSSVTSSAPAGDGAPGVVLEDTLLVTSGSRFQGGAGGDGASSTPLCGAPGNGGSGILLTGAGSDVQYLDSAFIGGGKGIDATPGGFCTGATGLPGPAAEGLGTGGTATQMSAAASLSLVASSPVREGGLVELAVAGPSGAPVFLALGEAPFDLFVPALAGTILVAPPYLVLALGVLDGDGKLAAELPLLDLPLGAQVKHYFGQAGYVAGGGAIVLGAPSAVTLLDSGF